jgi:hypothetical protein
MPRDMKDKKSTPTPSKASPEASAQAKRDKGKELFAKMAKTKLFPLDVQPLPASRSTKTPPTQ